MGLTVAVGFKINGAVIDIDDLAVEVQVFNAVEGVGAIVAVNGVGVFNHQLAVAIHAKLVVSRVTVEASGVITLVALKGVIANAACQGVITGVPV